MTRVLASGLVLLGIFACGEDPDVITPVFSDELVEAAGRTADVVVVTDQECDALKGVLHEQISDIASVVVSRRTAYPINPDERVLELAPRGRAIAIDVVVLDTNDNVVSRGCLETTLAPSASENLVIEMMALPICENPDGTPKLPTFIDIAIVLDASTEMQLADVALGNTVTDELKAFVDLNGFPANTRFSLVTHGPADPEEIVAPTMDREAVKAGLENFRNLAGGASRHFEAILLATERLRSRAICERRPALLIVSAGADRGPQGGFENATIGLAGARGDTRDDLYSFGIAMTEAAKIDLEDLIVDTELGELDTAGTQSKFHLSLENARFRFQGLVGP